MGDSGRKNDTNVTARPMVLGRARQRRSMASSPHPLAPERQAHVILRERLQTYSRSCPHDLLAPLTRWVLAHKRLVAGFWIVVTVAAFARVKPAGDALSQEFTVPGQEGFETNREIGRPTATAATSRRSSRS